VAVLLRRKRRRRRREGGAERSCNEALLLEAEGRSLKEAARIFYPASI
jgi:hypothetical protein